jgi:triosephosphate isomerase
LAKKLKFKYNKAMPKFLIANWKMNPQTLESAYEILDTILKEKNYSKKIELIICPPFLWLNQLIKKYKQINFGAQNASFELEGPFTGEISVLMLKNIKVKYVILGHSERREKLLETDEIINKKMTTVLEKDLIPILCIGENYGIRKKGIEFAKKFISQQLKKDLSGLSRFRNKKIIIAYEPIWAISTNSLGLPDNPKNANEIAEFIKKELKKMEFNNISVLYGGSVNSKNVLRFLKEKNIDGALVGGASIKKDEFVKMIQILNKGLKN